MADPHDLQITFDIFLESFEVKLNMDETFNDLIEEIEIKRKVGRGAFKLCSAVNDDIVFYSKEKMLFEITDLLGEVFKFEEENGIVQILYVPLKASASISRPIDTKRIVSSARKVEIFVPIFMKLHAKVEVNEEEKKFSLRRKFPWSVSFNNIYFQFDLIQ